MYDLRKRTTNGGGEVGYWKKSFSIYLSLSPSPLKRQSENLADYRLLPTARDLQTSLPPPTSHVSY